MSQIIVDEEKLFDFGKNLSQDASDFKAIAERMTAIVDALRGGWNGNDAETFITNATAYLGNLGRICQALQEASRLVNKNAKAYTERIDNFYAKLGG